MVLDAAMPHIDVDYPRLVRRCGALDELLDEIHASCRRSRDPDQVGLFDEVEATAGEGFGLCQQYMAQRRGTRPSAVAYGCGPLHAGLHTARIINAAANYWKHRGEWNYCPDAWTQQQRATADVVMTAGGCGGYPLSCLLASLTYQAPARFAEILPLVDEWRRALDPGGFIPD
jgi:hypothetical protein